jgi:hypothetical protein
MGHSWRVPRAETFPATDQPLPDAEADRLILDLYFYASMPSLRQEADSQEQVCPDWILENLKSDCQMSVGSFIVDCPIYWTGPKPELKARFVCCNCSRGWMSNLSAATAGDHGCVKSSYPFSKSNELGEEMVASYLYQVHLYHRLASNGHGRFLSDDDL